MALLIVNFCENQSIEMEKNDKMQIDSCLKLMTNYRPTTREWVKIKCQR